MISFHEDISELGNEKKYFKGFRWANVTSFQRLSVAVSRYAWSPCRWEGGRRVGTGFLEARLIGLDFDNGAMALDQALNIFCDSTHIIGTTKSHRKDKGGRVCDRFRVVLKLDEPITCPRAFRDTMTHYIEKYDCDEACKDAARFFWPCASIVSVVDDGYTQDVITKKTPDIVYERVALDEGELTAYAIYFLRTVIPHGSRNRACHRFAKDMLRAGLKPEEIYALIIRSTTYLGQSISSNLRDEIMGTISSGSRAVKEEQTGDRKSGGT